MAYNPSERQTFQSGPQNGPQNGGGRKPAYDLTGPWNLAAFKAAYMIKVQGGRDYLPVAARVIWFRKDHPLWGIETKAVEVNWEKQYAAFQCRVTDENGRLKATGHKREDVKGFPDYYEKAEAGSIGRALGFLGYSTDGAGIEDESHPLNIDDAPGHIVDSPSRQSGESGQENGYSNAYAPVAAPASHTPVSPEDEGETAMNPDYIALNAQCGAILGAMPENVRKSWEKRIQDKTGYPFAELTLDELRALLPHLQKWAKEAAETPAAPEPAPAPPPQAQKTQTKSAPKESAPKAEVNAETKPPTPLGATLASALAAEGEEDDPFADR